MHSKINIYHLITIDETGIKDFIIFLHLIKQLSILYAHQNKVLYDHVSIGIEQVRPCALIHPIKAKLPTCSIELHENTASPMYKFVENNLWQLVKRNALLIQYYNQLLTAWWCSCGNEGH